MSLLVHRRQKSVVVGPITTNAARRDIRFLTVCTFWATQASTYGGHYPSPVRARHRRVANREWPPDRWPALKGGKREGGQELIPRAAAWPHVAFWWRCRLPCRQALPRPRPGRSRPGDQPARDVRYVDGLRRAHRHRGAVRRWDQPGQGH